MYWTIGVVPQRPSTTRAPAVLKITQERPNKEKPEKADNKKKDIFIIVQKNWSKNEQPWPIGLFKTGVPSFKTSLYLHKTINHNVIILSWVFSQVKKMNYSLSDD